jgi:hypothetical protein
VIVNAVTVFPVAVQTVGPGLPGSACAVAGEQVGDTQATALAAALLAASAGPL